MVVAISNLDRDRAEIFGTELKRKAYLRMFSDYAEGTDNMVSRAYAS
jgi:hypothetical protein